jgi:4-hydroxy-tetrahydrodipicolinate synthase
MHQPSLTKNTTKFDGPVFTVFTAFGQNNELDIPATLKYVDFLLEHNVRHLYIMPYNSRYLQLSSEEILLLNISVIKHVKLNSNADIIVSGSVECSTAKTIEFCDKAFEAGTDFFASAFGEKYFSDNQILDHYGALTDKFQSIIVHEQPLISGYNSTQMNWPVSLIDDISSLNGIVAFKEDTKSFEFGKMILDKKLSTQMIFAGRKSLLAPLSNYGLSAYLNGISIINPKIAFIFWELVKSKNSKKLDEFVRTIDNPFWEGPVKKYGWHRVNKASLECFGLMSRRDRMPLPALKGDEFSELSLFWKKHMEVVNEWL